MRTTLRPWLLGAESLNNFASRRVKRYSWRMFLRLQEILWVFIGTAHSFVIYLLMYFVLYVVYIYVHYMDIYIHTHTWIHVIPHIYVEVNILFEFGLKSSVQSKPLQTSKVFSQVWKYLDEKCLSMTTRGC